ncbi:alanine dehydrogenase [Marinobacter zhejiangensis]|uniref:Alanine dehydrogenase n=1 Tax=Marinobacter zhejiangensis TaxID=488535 RepID=A0A1I4L774_9GAMM|nr:alanine dehydrogenase [Marinobacter zhejiangensis]SFL86507.1 alanine dehydrogenase [Marinobacter zhejiangensis]
MLIGVPKEIKNHEYRVGLIPASVRELCHNGHQVVVEAMAGAGTGFSDADYGAAGALLVDGADEVYARAEMIVKVKEPQASERRLLNSSHTLFTYLHLAPDRPQTDELVASGALCIAYETVTDELGHLPLLAPMSEVAGRMAVQAGAYCLEKSMGGRGVLLGGVPGVSAARVTVIGGGVVGRSATTIAVGMGADVTVLDRDLGVLRHLDHVYGNRIKTLFSTQEALEQAVINADLVVGAVLVPGASTPKLVTRDMLRRMAEGSVFVDVAIDQGGCGETSRPTTHADPTFVEEGVVHYCVANMPGAVARTSAMALNNATLPFVLALANKGPVAALRDDPHLLAGLNIGCGQVVHPSVAEAHGYTPVAASILLDQLSRR